MSRVASDAREEGALLIATPLRFEALVVRSGVRGGRVCVTGMGPKRARAAAHALSERRGRALLVLGFCGSLEPDGAPGDVVVADELVTLAGRSSDASSSEVTVERVECPQAGSLAGVLERNGVNVRRGAIVCVSRPALGRRRAELGERSGAIAVDMESVWLGAGAAERPFGVVRVVLDSPGHELVRPGAPVSLLRGAIVLRKVASALHEWQPEH